MEKRGLAHIEIIISFILFVGFLLAGLYFFNPVGLGTQRLLESTLFYANDGISENLTSKVTFYSVVINSSVPSGTNIVRVPMNIGPGMSVRVEKNNGDAVQANYNAGQVIFDRGGERFFMIKAGEFAENYAGLQNSILLSAEQYSISSSDEREFMSELKANDLKSKYDSDYASLKEQFNLPSRMDFAFSLKLDGTEIKAEKQIPEGIEISAESSKREILRSDGQTGFGELIVRVW